MAGALERAGVESARLCAEMLVTHTLGCDRMRLYMEPDRPASPEELGRLRALTARALKHEPVQYLVGEAWFFSLAFAVDGRVLIPRPCTEGIVEEVVQMERRRDGETERRSEAGEDGAHDVAGPSPARAGEVGERSEPGGGARGVRILDLCTGSGCIAVALAKNLPGAQVVASDVSGGALEVARANIERHGVAARIDLREGDLWGAVRDGEVFDYVVANPPYIPDPEWDDPEMMGANVKGQEPEVALRGGGDGLDVVRPIVEGCAHRMASGGVLIVEVAASTAGAVCALACAQDGLVGARVVEDHEGLPRFVMARRRG